MSAAGRMMSKRVMGKASFCHVQDLQGMIQCYVARDNLGEEAYKEFKKLDIGDIVGVKGTVFKTKTGEISIHVTELTLLSQEPADPSGKVPRSDQHGSPLPPEIRGSDYEQRGQGYLYQAFQNDSQHPELSE